LIVFVLGSSESNSEILKCGWNKKSLFSKQKAKDKESIYHSELSFINDHQVIMNWKKTSNPELLDGQLKFNGSRPFEKARGAFELKLNQ
jgi:hypothetical protein